MSLFFGWNLPMFQPARQKGGNAQYLNNLQCMDIFNRVVNIALSRFRWMGLPDSCNSDILEQTLFFYGRAVFFLHEDGGLIHTPVNLPGPFNIYYQSTVREAYSFGPFHKTLSMDDSVLCRNNKTMTPDYLSVWNYVPKIANCLRAIDVHTETLKRPFMISCGEKETTSVKKALNSISDNEPAVVGDRLANPDSIKVLSLGTVSNLPDMWANVKNYCNQVFSSLGVRNTFTSKKERVITAESEGDTNAIRHVLESCLSMRQQAAQEVNEMFGTHISVEANELEVFTDEMLEMQAARVAGNLDREGNDPE